MGKGKTVLKVATLRFPPWLLGGQPAAFSSWSTLQTTGQPLTHQSVPTGGGERAQVPSNPVKLQELML